MKDLYVIGAGGFGKEIVHLILQCELSYNLKAVVDYEGGKEIIVETDTIPVIPESELMKTDLSKCGVVIAVASPEAMQRISEKYKKIGVIDFPNVIHPSALIANSLKKGVGNIIAQNVVISVDVEMGNFNVVNLSSTIGHDMKMNNYNVINPGTNVSGGVEINELNLMGTNSTILQYLKIGSNCTIGAGSLVAKDVNDGETIIGNPGRVMRRK